jgi:hypothetical protein
MLQPGRRPRHGFTALVILFAGLLSGCGDETPPDTTPPPPPPDLISRETFVETYVELRFAALDRGMQEPALEDRDAVLERMGVEGEQLFDFIEFYGPYVDFMRELWDEIEATVDRGRPSDRPTPEPATSG